MSYWDDPRRDARLRELWEQGEKFSAIAAALTAEFGLVTRNAVIGRAGRIHLGSRTVNPARAPVRPRRAREPGARTSRPAAPAPPPPPPPPPEPEPEPEPEPAPPEDPPFVSTTLSPQFLEAISPNPKGGTRLFNLGLLSCRRIVEGERLEALFCGRPTGGSPYCARCRPLMFVPATGRVREPRAS